jgi:glycerol-3-phosphate dehydrogenase (NAD(P)+)
MGLNRICFIGAGAIATALGNSLARTGSNHVTLISIEREVVNSINEEHINRKYFPGIELQKNLAASTDTSLLEGAEMIFLAIPSVETVNYLRNHRKHIPGGAIIVNLAKGFGENQCMIIDCLKESFPNPVCPMKGPTFARDIINNQPTGFTVGTGHPELVRTFRKTVESTNIYLDFSEDAHGVEILSILKNIYSIVIGITDASFDAPNLRSLILNKSFKEMRNLTIEYGGKESTMFKYCGFGDFTLTALNDLSRNRTLGLLIGKGFFTREMSDKVVLEGKIAVNVIMKKLEESGSVSKYPILAELYKVFNNRYDLSSFVSNILRLSEDREG